MLHVNSVLHFIFTTMSYSYVVTSQRPTAVSFSIVCNFTGEEDKNLIIAKGNFLVIYAVRPEGLEVVVETPLFGRIKSLDYYRPHGSKTDVLFVLTERKSFCVLGYDGDTQKIITRAVGNVRDRAGRDVEIGQRGIVDPDYRMIGMMLYEGQLKVIPVEGSGMKEAFNVALNETRIIDIKFLYGCPKPTICLLYQDNRNVRHVKTWVVDTKEKELTPGPWSQSNVEFGASMIIPVPSPLGGILLVGSSSITYIGQSAAGSSSTGPAQMQVQAVEIAPAQVIAGACIAEDATRFLVADHRGVLSAVVLCLGANNEVTSLALDNVGTTSIAETLTYLGDGHVYIGSIFGDSQLVRLHTDRDEQGSNVEVLATHTNIGPIRDMCLVDNDRQGGQRQLVTCSGAYKDGSLRVIRSGIGLQEQASLEVPGIKALWSLRTHEDAEFDKYLVQSFVGETRILAIENEEMGEIEISGFLSQEATLYCANMQGGAMVQVTARSVRLVDCADFHLLSEYVCPSTITVASGTLSQLTLAVSGGEVLYLELDMQTKSFKITSSAQLDQDIACLSLRPVSGAREGAMEVEATGSAAATARSSSILAVAMWTDNSVRLHALPTLEEICRVQLGTDVQARDILIVELGDKVYLLIGLGDGRLITYTVDFSGDLPSLVNRRNGVLGTHPITFSCFQNAGAQCVFAACDRPTVMYSKNGKVLFSVLDVSQTEFTNMAPFHSELFPYCLALCSEASLVIGVIEDIQKVHIQTIPLGQAPSRIRHSAANGVYAVTAEKTARTENGEESKWRVLFFDDSSMEQVAIMELDPLEQALSCTTCVFHQESANGGSADVTMTDSSAPMGSSSPGLSSSRVNASSAGATEYFVVGTAYVVGGELEPSRGRILVFEVAENKKVHIVAEREVKGAAFSLAQVCGRLVAGIGSKVQVFGMNSNKEDATSFTGQPELQLEATHTSQIMALYLKVKGDNVLVGDLVRSLTLLRFKPQERVLQEVARDLNSSYLRAVEVMDGAEEDVYLGTDINGNLQCMRQAADAVSDEERSRLECCGEFSLGEYLNAFSRGSLVGQPIESDSQGKNGGGGDAASSAGSVLSPNYTSITGLKVGTCSVLYGGVSGGIGNILALSEESYRFFAAVERVMKRSVVSIGGLNHREWRNFQNDLRSAPQRNVVDGDLVEMILEFDREKLESVVREVNDELNAATAALNSPNSGSSAKANGSNPITTSSTGNMLLHLATDKINLSVEEVLHRVEDISRLH